MSFTSRVLILFLCGLINAQAQDINATRLPNSLEIYVKDSIILTTHENGFQKKTIPIANDTSTKKGCYIACYSTAQNDTFILKPNVSLHGLIRVAGSYNSYRCSPLGLKQKDLRREPSLHKLCYQNFKSCRTPKSPCWAGGDTEGWFTISLMSQAQKPVLLP